MYEIQIDNTNTFPAPDTRTTIEPFFTLENINSVKFVRVRGIRGDGLTGNWSTTVRIQPNITAPLTHTSRFYPTYIGANPLLQRTKCFGGEKAPKFYQLFNEQFYADRFAGGFSVWGYVSNRLKEFKDGEQFPVDRVKFKVNGIDRMENYFTHWTNTFPEEATNPRRHPTTGRVMTFYNQGGYTASFGPYAVTLPNSVAGEGANDPLKVSVQDASGATFYWDQVISVRRPSRYEKGLISDIMSGERQDESGIFGMPDGASTAFLKCQDFRFNLKPGDSITGIEVDVKRRQNANPDASITADFGKADQLRVMFGHDGLSDADIGDDPDFNKFLEFGPAVLDKQLLTGTTIPIDTDVLEVADEFTFGFWVNFNTLGSAADNPNRVIAHINSTVPTGANSIRLNTFHNASFAPNGGGLTVSLSDSVGATLRNKNYIESTTGFVTGTWHYIAIVKEDTASGGDFTLYIDGLAITPDSTAGLAAPLTTTDSPDRRVSFGGHVDTPGVPAPQLDGKMAQGALWNTALIQPEIAEIYLEEFKSDPDLRNNFGDYKSSAFLKHLWMFFPGAADIRDFEVFLVDETNTIRSDLDNKAVTDESWPLLAEFLEVNSIFIDNNPVGTSTGIPHDNVIGIGYQQYGGEQDTWGSAWTGAQLNNKNFGVAIRAKNEPNVFAGNGFIDHVKMTAYVQPEGDREVEVSIEAEAVAGFYWERELFGAMFNAIEIGERLAPDLSDC
jgi:hypothetical protein